MKQFSKYREYSFGNHFKFNIEINKNKVSLNTFFSLFNICKISKC